MRKIIIFLLVLALSVFVAKAYGHCLFVKALGGSNNTVGNSVIKTSDGGFVVTGYTKSYGAGGMDVLLTKFGSAGNRLWSKTLGGSGDEEGRSVIETHDGGIVVTGYTNSFGGTGDHLLLAKFNSAGTRLWTKVLTRTDGSLDFKGYSVIEDSDHNLIVTGTMWRDDLQRFSLLFVKYDSNGDTLLIRSAYNPVYPNRDHYGYSVVQRCSGDYLVAGGVSGPDIGGNILLAGFNSNGSFAWGYWIGEEGVSNPDAAYSLIRTSNCGFVLTGSTVGDLFVLRRDQEVNPFWSRKFFTGASEGHSVIETFDGGMVVAGGYSGGSGNVLLAKWTAGGTHLWTRTFGGNSYEIGNSVIEQSDPQHNLQVTGETNSWGIGGKDLLSVGCDYLGGTCLPDMGGPSSNEWNPAEGWFPGMTQWIPLLLYNWDWSPTVTSPTPPETIVCALGTTYVVKPDGTGNFPTIQDAINAACDGDTIELTNGRFHGTKNRDIDYINKAITVRSQNGAEACTVDCSGSKISPHGGFYFHRGEGQGSRLEGVTIMNGILFGPIDARGAGILCVGSSPTIINCKIIENWANDAGGGICCDSASPIIIDCTISGNGTDGNGGGMCCVNASPIITGCVFTGNWANGNGGGIYCPSSSNPSIISCTISGNVADTGGGIYGSPNLPEFERTIVWGDSAAVGHEWYGDGGGFRTCCLCLDSSGLDGFSNYVVVCSGDRPNIYSDPWFCCPDTSNTAPTTKGNYTLCPSSPCAPPWSPGDCGLIGALGVGSCPYRGDCNGSGQIELGDVVCMITCLYKGGHCPDPLWILDVNCSGSTPDLGDIVYLISFLYKGGRPPCCYCP